MQSGPNQSEPDRVDLVGDLARVAVPTLVFVATGDRLVLPASQRLLAAGIAGAEVVELVDAGHVLVTSEEWSRWLADVRDFLARRVPR